MRLCSFGDNCVLASALPDRPVSQSLFADPFGPLPSDPLARVSQIWVSGSSQEGLSPWDPLWVTDQLEVISTPAVLNFWVGGGALGWISPSWELDSSVRWWACAECFSRGKLPAWNSPCWLPSCFNTPFRMMLDSLLGPLVPFPSL